MSELETTSLEDFVQIPGHPGYEVNRLGQVRSVDRWAERLHWKTGKLVRLRVKGTMMKPVLRHIRGKPVCCTVTLWYEGAGLICRIHRLVLLTFIGPCPDGEEGCHNDGNPANNRLSNLRWDTHIENISDCIRHNTKTKPPVHCGKDHPNTKLTNGQVKEIRAVAGYRGVLVKLGKQYGVSHQTIRRIRLGMAWSTK